MIRTVVVLAALAALAGCSGEAEPEVEFRRLQGLGNYAMIVSKDVDPAILPRLAKEQCGVDTHCSVFAWADSSKAATGFPLTDAEVASQVFSYTLNRASGLERSLWNCAVYPRPDAGECLAVD